MNCPKCQAEVTEESNFCSNCGYDLRQTQELPSKHYSHPQSYTPRHLAEQILTTRSSIQGERKLVTVLFADVANYTSIAEKLDPEEVHQIMDGCFKILLDEIHRYEGTINQFTGDGVMALFGAPIAHEDHAQRACLAALGIQEALAKQGDDLKARQGIDFQMRIGLNSGPVVVGSIGDDLRMDYTAVGDTTNLAARMEQLARPGTVLLTEDTNRIVLPYFQCQSVGEIKVKGREEPVQVYKLKAKHEVYRPRLGLEREIYSEMVGRDKELDLLEFQIMKAVTGEGSIVSIIGEAGIGKSRLVAELKNHDVMNRVTLLEGRAISMGRNLSFHPIIDLLKHWARINERDTEPAAFDKLRSSIWNVCPEEPDEVLPFVATLMGMKLSDKHAQRLKGIEGGTLEKMIHKNVRHLLVKATEIGPLVILMEDLHWADTSSIELLEFLFRLAKTQRIVFVNVFRPDHKETGDRIIQALKEELPRHYVEIRLEPLDERMSQLLINNMLNIKGLHRGVTDQIVERSGGNPFFIEEVVRSLLDREAVVLKDGKFEVTENIERVVIPHTIQDVLMARIDHLDEKTRDLVKVASVIGRSFFYRVVKEVTKTTEDIDSRLSYLKEIQLIRERRRLEELEYLFKHALAQETAYESILLRKRKELHHTVADSIEKVFKEKLHEFYGMLAYHYSKAEDEEKAQEYLTKAGEEALRSSASSEALHYYREALELYLRKYGDAADPEKIAMFEKNIALAFHARGQYTEALGYFDKSLAYYWGSLPRHSIFSYSKFLVSFLRMVISLYLPFLGFRKVPTTRDSEIINLYYKKLEALTDIDPKRFFVEAGFLASRLTNFDLTRVENGLAMYVGISAAFSWPGISFTIGRKLLEFCKKRTAGDDLKSISAYDMGSTVLNFSTGDWDVIKGLDDNSVEERLNIGEMLNTLVCLLFQGWIKIDQGQFDEAERIVDKFAEIGELYDNDYSRAYQYELNVKLKMKRRRFQQTLQGVEEGIDFITKTAMKVYVRFFYTMKARIQIMLGDIKGAKTAFSLGKEYGRDVMAVPYYRNSLLICEFILGLHHLEESIASGKRKEFTKARRTALRTGRRMVRTSRRVACGRTESYKLMGIYYWVTGRQRKALQWWRRSIREGERIFARLELSRTYMEVGKRLLEPKSRYKELNGMTAEECLQKARTMFEEMDLEWDLDELARIPSTN